MATGGRPLRKALEKLREKKKKKMGTPKFAPGKGGGSDAARKGKGTIGKKKKIPQLPGRIPLRPRTPSRPKRLTPAETQKIIKKQIKEGKKPRSNMPMLAKGGRPGLYANIHAKRKSGRPMRKKGAAGAPTAANFRRAAQTVRKK